MYQLQDMLLVSISEAKAKLSALIRQVVRDNEIIYILNHNRPEVVLLSADRYEHLQREFESMERRLLAVENGSVYEPERGLVKPVENAADFDPAERPQTLHPDPEKFD